MSPRLIFFPSLLLLAVLVRPLPLLTLRRPDEFVKTFTRKLLTYAVGRGLEASDEPIVRRIVSQAARDGYRFSSIVAGIATSEPFRMKVKKES